jgi:hypothetical protein
MVQAFSEGTFLLLLPLALQPFVGVDKQQSSVKTGLKFYPGVTNISQLQTLCPESNFLK